MTEHEHDETPDVDEAALAEDLEIKDAEEADTIKGGGHVVGIKQAPDSTSG